ncbi:hypothetical protein HELRODRAFT_159317 [Helobdella robusta]|uniref:Uncharacterized protein n=1 Tax=Helobdella robusta TaxID=6412 RepID=T1ENV8_HELRO|nr:hypothetical protein HELRODRAFT_159317 [Helobdella robusta]ESO12734.1 hypothetical protein HELRODRAFT_159317 [Helobdella robusta]
MVLGGSHTEKSTKPLQSLSCRHLSNLDMKSVLSHIINLHFNLIYTKFCNHSASIIVFKSLGLDWRPPKQASANFQQAQSTPPRTAPSHSNKDQLHFLSSNFFHNKSPDTDDGNDDDNQDDDNDDDVGDKNYNDSNNYSNDNKNNLFESPQLQYINDDNQKDFPTVLSSSSLPIMMSGHDMMNSSSSSSTAFAPAPLLPTNKMPPMPPVKIERKVFPTDLSLSFVSSCDDDRLLNDSLVQSVNHDDEDVGAGDGNDGLMNENIGNSQQTLKDYVNSSKQISDSCNSQASNKKRKNFQNFVCHDSCNKRNVNISSSAKVKSSAINSCHNNNPSSLTLNKTNNNTASALKTGKPSTIDKNFKPSSYANKKSFNNSTKAGTSSFNGNGNNSKPPTPPLRRMPSWNSMY